MSSLEIKEKRKELGLTQNELAKKIGVSVSTIVNYENGKIIPESKKEILNDILCANSKKQKVFISYSIEDLKEYRIDKEDIITIRTDLENINHHLEKINILKGRLTFILDSIENQSLNK